jgi:acetylxylan esterase
MACVPPAQSWTETVYGGGSKLLGFCTQEAGHISPFQEEAVLKFFGIM